MKWICGLAFFVVLIAAVYAQESTIAYAGTTANAPALYGPSFASNGACTTSTFTAPYVYFNVSYSTSGVREVAAMAEQSYIDDIAIYVYSSFNPAAPCANIVGQALIDQYDADGGPIIDDFFYFLAGVNYTFIVTTDDSGADGGIFAVNIFPSTYYGQTSVSGPFWPAIGDTTTPGTACQAVDETADIPFTYYTWTQPNSGYFDVVALFSNTTFTDTNDYWSTYLALYNSSFSNISMLSDNPCTANLVNAAYNDESMGVTLYYVWLSAGANYTVVASGAYSDQTGYLGIQITPTKIRFPVLSGYTQPERNPDPVTDCSASDDTDCAYGATSFVASERVYLFDTQNPPEPFQYFDTYSFMYSGNNTSGAIGNAPSTCPVFGGLIIGGDTGDVTPVYAYTNINQTYTVVVSTYNGESLSPSAGTTYAYLFFYFTGLPIGSIPSATTAAAATATTANTGTTFNPTVATGTASGTTSKTTASTVSGGTTASATTSKTTTTAASATTAKTTTTGNSGVTTSRVSTTSSASSVVISTAVVMSTAYLLL